MVTATGYRRRTFEEILTAKIEKAKELFGENINTEENTALGKYIRINAYDQYNVEEIAEKIYYSIFPQTASGQSLDRLGWIVGITRNAAVPSRYQVTVTGTEGAIVEYGFLVSTESGINFYNTEEATIGEDGECVIEVECVEAGVIGNVARNEINRIVRPSAMIESVEGLWNVQVGVDEESDYDFIKRFEIVREGKGSGNETAIISALTSIPTVHGAYLRVNESATETVDGMPPKTIACYVDGGATKMQEIAEAIFDKKPVGIGTYGRISKTVTYGATNYTVNFSYAENVPIYIKLTLTTNDEFESDGNEKIMQNIVSFIDSLAIGQQLVTTALYKQIYSVAGVESASVEVSTNGNTYSTNTITVEPYACCAFEELEINGTVM